MDVPRIPHLPADPCSCGRPSVVDVLTVVGFIPRCRNCAIDREQDVELPEEGTEIPGALIDENLDPLEFGRILRSLGESL